MKAKTAPPKVEKVLYSKKDAAYALSLSVRTIDSMMAEKLIRVRRIGGRVLIPATEVRRISRGDQPMVNRIGNGASR